jgi:hypothetical protein
VGRNLACETLGLEYGRVRLLDHDEAWAIVFERESDRAHVSGVAIRPIVIGQNITLRYDREVTPRN